MIAFDHLVVFSNQPEQHKQLFSSLHGQVTVKGGEHEQWGTFNHLAFMGNKSYIEWIGVEDDDKAKESTNPLIRQVIFAKEQSMEGPIQFGLRVEDLNAYINHFDQEGIEYEGPFPGSRAQPDGTLLEWTMLFPKMNSHTVLPFLIQWDGEGNTAQDPSLMNSTEFDSVTIYTQNLESTTNQMKGYYLLEEPSHSSENEVEWSLGNGKLIVKKGDGLLKANFDHIEFNQAR
ncbi:VOC family protein [Halalkalibacillus sediminis]|nr:VOC family protein [Halalkalibacillus sediminis]